MVKVLYSFPIDGLQGKVAGNSGLVYSDWRGIPVARRFVQPSNPDSLAQQTVRSWLSSAAQQFGSISASEKTAWETFAQLTPRKVNGRTLILPAISAYAEINSLRQLGGQAITDTAPTVVSDFSVTAITRAEDLSPNLEIDFAHSATVTAGKFVLVKTTAPLNSARVNPGRADYRSILPPQTGGAIIALAASPQTLTITIADMWTPVAAADFLGISIQPLSSEYVPGQEFRSVLTVA